MRHQSLHGFQITAAHRVVEECGCPRRTLVLGNPFALRLQAGSDRPAGCACSPTGCAVGLECIAGECWSQSPYPNCGWNDEHDWYACGSSVAFPWGGLACPETELVAGMPCPIDPGVYTTGCCDTNGNNWWCEGGVLAFDDCSDAP